MAGRGAGITSAFVFGGFLCIGLILVCIAAAIILSLIPTFTTNHSQQGYGAEYTFDAFMLKFLYTNNSEVYSNGTIGNSTALSELCTAYMDSKGYKNFAGCVVYNGEAWGPYNTSTNSRRRRRAVTVGLYAIFSGRLFRTVSCPSVSDQNKTENSSSLSNCNLQAIEQCNSLVNDLQNSFSTWTTSNAPILEVVDAIDLIDYLSTSAVYGIPRQLAVAIANSLPNISPGVKGNLQRGCRYVGPRSLAYIDAVLASQTSSLPYSASTEPTSG